MPALPALEEPRLSQDTCGSSIAVILWKEQQMKYFRIALVVLIALTMIASARLATPISHASQGQSTALERGYRTGYSDGYSAGSRDLADKAAEITAIAATINALIATTTKPGARSRIIATVTSRVLKPVITPATIADRSSRLYLRDFRAVEPSLHKTMTRRTRPKYKSE